MTTASGELIVSKDGTVDTTIKVLDMPKYNTMSIYLIYNNKSIAGIDKYNRLKEKTYGTPTETIKITSPNGLDTFFSLTTDYTITIDHTYPQLINADTSKVYIKISFWDWNLQTQSRKPVYITTGKKACAISLKTFILPFEKTYYSYKAPYSAALKSVEENGLADIPTKDYKTGEVNNILPGGKYSLTVDYKTPISFTLAHNRNTRPDGQPANSTYMQFSDFLSGHLWSRVRIDSNCQISSTAPLTYWVKYPAHLTTVKKAPSSGIVKSIGRDIHEIIPNISTPELVLGVVALFLIAKILSDVIP